MRAHRRLIVICLAALLATGATYAVFTATSSNTGNSVASSADWTAPSVSRATVQHATAPLTGAGYLRQNQTYYAYAQVDDSGSPASGVSSVQANLAVASNVVTTGKTSVTMCTNGGPFTVGGQSYNYRSDDDGVCGGTATTLTTDNPLSAGSRNFSITATDGAANSGSQTSSVTIDNTAPTLARTAVERSAGGGAGYLKAGSTYYVYAEASDATSGMSRVQSNVCNITLTSCNAVTLSAGTWTVNGQSYNYRSTIVTADGGLSEGSKTYSVTAEDNTLATTSTSPSVTIDNTAPSIARTAVESTSGSATGFIKQGGSYYAYAQITDAASGVGLVTADISTVTSGQIVAAMTSAGGPWTVGGQTYNYRTASTTADTPLTDGSYAFSVSSTDNVANSGSLGGSVTVDNSPPTIARAEFWPATNVPGYVHQGGVFFILAHVSDPTGLGNVTADVHNFATGVTSVSMGPIAPSVVDGQTYNYVGASTADNPLSTGSKSWTLTAEDAIYNSTTGNHSATVENSNPTVSRSTIAKTSGAGNGYISQGSNYYAYAQVDDVGPSGVYTAQANVGNITAGQTAAVMSSSGGPWTVNGQTYNFRTASIAADTPLSEGSKSYTISPFDNAGNTTTVSGFSVPVDNSAPSASPTVGSKSYGWLTSFVRPNGTYYLYANVSDGSGSGIAGVTADASNFTSGQTAVPMVSGSYSAAGVSFNYRTAQLTADGSLTAGAKSWGVTSIDNAGNSQTQSGANFSVVTANGGANSFDATNNGGGIAGRMELNDVISYVYSDTIDPESVQSGWTPAANDINSYSNVVVRLNDGGGGNDTISIYDSTNTTPVTLGTINLGGTGYTSSNITFGATGTTSKMRWIGFANGVQITLGTPSATATTQAGNTTATFTPSTSTYNGAGVTFAGTPVNSTIDNSGPSVTTAIAKTPGYLSGSIKQGGSYYIYANVTDTNAISAVTANVNNITTGSTSVAMVAGSYSANGTSYNYRSAVQTANGSLTAGSKSYTVTATDNRSNQTVQTGSVTVDNTAATATDVQATNDSGGTLGRAENGDKLAFTTSEQLDPESILSGWTGASTSVTVRFTNNGSNDYIEIYNAGNTTVLPLGLIQSSANHTSTAGATFPATMVQSGSVITITLGTLSAGSVNTISSSPAMTWAPSSAAYDVAGVTMSGAQVSEQGGADKDF